jgi:hypothetical protein
MKEKLSVGKVYRNAYRYVISHLFAFFFLTFFYFMGSLLPRFLVNSSLFAISSIYIYLFFYFAAGCYFRQQILWDKQIFINASLRFITAIVLFLIALLLSTFLINLGINFIKISFNLVDVDVLLHSSIWIAFKYVCIYLLFIIFFMIPSFAFVSEITGKNRSLLMTYAKTKGNIFRISAVTAIAVAILIVSMVILSHANIWIASLVRAGILVFISILYFKMYDFFYLYPLNKKTNCVEK